MRHGRWAILCVWFALQGCGYHLASQKYAGGTGKTISIPTFTNLTTNYRIEQRITEAVRREFIERTRFKVTPQPDGDLVVTGIVRAFAASPIFFDERGRASAYNIGVDLGVVIKDAKTGAVVLENEHWGFNEPFELARVSEDFVPEDSAAMERLARRFASAVVASLLQTNP
ncbi:MAG TPA: LPS assembly lipoprotein LptE [Terriglobia bacterium]|nr:LPS assembly lipoprotein LptE [Terriglobia bacterium]